MKVILYMAMTANGIIAKQDDSANFLTPEENASYVVTVKKAGHLVIGRRTYDVLSQQPEFQEFIKAGIKIVAVSRGDFKVSDPNHLVAHSPKEALELLGNVPEVVVAGGAMLNASFVEEGLVDEMFIDIEPALLGKGIPLFNGADFEKKLKFLGTKHISDNEIQLHYEVLK